MAAAKAHLSAFLFVKIFFFFFFLSSWKIENEKEPPLVLLMCFGFKILMCVHIICIAKPSPKQAEFETGYF